MSQTLRQFARDFTKLANSNDRGSEVAKKVAIAIVRNLTYVTPVDTSRALSNWQVSLDGKMFGTISPYFFGSRGSTQEFSAAYAISAAIKIIENKKPGQAIWISNNLRYIRNLNDGSSSQQAANFVARAELIGRKVAAKG